MTSPGIRSTSSPAASPTSSRERCDCGRVMHSVALAPQPVETFFRQDLLLLQHVVFAFGVSACAILWPHGLYVGLNPRHVAPVGVRVIRPFQPLPWLFQKKITSVDKSDCSLSSELSHALDQQRSC